MNWMFFSNVIVIQKLAPFFTVVVVSFLCMLFLFYSDELERTPVKSRRLCWCKADETKMEIGICHCCKKLFSNNPFPYTLWFSLLISIILLSFLLSLRVVFITIQMHVHISAISRRSYTFDLSDNVWLNLWINTYFGRNGFSKSIT